MRILVVTLLCAAACVLSPRASYADNPYYLEIGQAEPDSAAAQSSWNSVSAKHKSVLSGLSYSPATLTQPDGKTQVRVQAGPINSKSKAQALCNKLFRQDVSCFVIEGYTKATAPLADNSQIILPWRIRQPEPINIAEASQPAETASDETPAPKKHRRGFFGRMFHPFENSGSDDKSSGSGKVEVAEAIRVPLTEGQQAPSSKAAPAKSSISVADIGEGSGAAAGSSGWLNVEPFSSPADATGFWQDVRTKVPGLAASLRVRVVHPLASIRSDEVSLNVGPFASQQDAMAFCSQGIRAQNPSLHCRFDSSEPAENQSQLVPSFASHNNAYEARRQRLTRGRPVSDNSMPASASQPQYNGKAYWLKVAEASSQMEALRVWEQLRTDNADLLDGVRSSVSASLVDKSSYQVKVGPINDQDRAIELCKSLQSRNLACKIYSNH